MIISVVCGIKKNKTYVYTEQKRTQRHRKQNLWLPKRRGKSSGMGLTDTNYIIVCRNPI